MLDSPIFGDEYRRQLAAGAQPLSDTPPVEVQAPAPTATVEAGGRPGKAGPALEDMANDPFFADAYRDAVARGDIVPDKLEQMASGMDPGSNEYKLRRMAQGLQPNAAPADIAGVGPSATRPAMSPSEKIAQRMALEAKDAAYAAEQAKANPGLAERVANKVADFDLQNYSAKVDANRAALETSRDGRIANGLDALYDGGKALLLGAAPFAAAAWMGAREAATMNPEGDLRYMSFNLKQGPLNMGKVGQHKDYLLQHPDVTHQLWMDGVLSSEVYDELNAERMSP
jgi:hypothetical protein